MLSPALYSECGSVAVRCSAIWVTAGSTAGGGGGRRRRRRRAVAALVVAFRIAGFVGHRRRDVRRLVAVMLFFLAGRAGAADDLVERFERQRVVLNINFASALTL